MSDKPLAQIAFEAATAGAGLLWDKLDPANRKAWMRAADAVAKAVKAREPVHDR
jgi:hypothetical protein